MILTGAAIADAHQAGDILIDPYDPARLSPNAYDWRLGEQIRTCTGVGAGGVLDAAVPTEYTETTISAAGMVLRPGVLYLGVTHERTGSERYAQLINGDRTIGALGIWVHVSAPLGHAGHAIRWTLEICVARLVRVYPLMTFGKIVFLETYGDLDSYQRTTAKYARTNGIDISRLHEELRDGAKYGDKGLVNRR
jgi:dCTP deaminase